MATMREEFFKIFEIEQKEAIPPERFLKILKKFGENYPEKDFGWLTVQFNEQKECVLFILNYIDYSFADKKTYTEWEAIGCKKEEYLETLKFFESFSQLTVKTYKDDGWWEKYDVKWK